MYSVYKNFSLNMKILLCFVVMIKLISCTNNSDKSIIEQISWECANNASCVNMMSKNIINSYKNGESLNFGLFSLEKLQHKLSDPLKQNNGRSSSSLTDFLQGNIIKFPIGPMVFSISRAEDDDDYIELALLKKASFSQGRRNRDKIHRKDKKQMQMFIPMYLAATTFGWTLFAVKSVALLTVKALLVSKLAFLVTVAVIIKKVMDSASEKMLMSHHQPYMMPYHMDYGMHSHPIPSEISTNDFYNLHLPNHHQSHGMESMGAESNLAHAIEIQANATQPQILAAIAAANAAAAAAGGHQKIKRNDSQWTGVKTANPLVYSYLPGQQQVYVYRK